VGQKTWQDETGLMETS